MKSNAKCINTQVGLCNKLKLECDKTRTQLFQSSNMINDSFKRAITTGRISSKAIERMLCTRLETREL